MMGHDSSYKKLSLVHAKLSRSKIHRPNMKPLPISKTFCPSKPCLLPTISSFAILALFYLFQSRPCLVPNSSHSQNVPNFVKIIQDNVLSRDKATDRTCQGRRIFMYDVPAQFNEDLAQECTIAGRGPCAEPWGCLYCGGLENEGKGLQVPDNRTSGNLTVISQNGYNYNYTVRLRPENAWYRTHQFALEVVFHAKMKKYACLTREAAMADAFYIPYYAGQDAAVSMRCNVMQVRDRRVNRFLGWLTGQETWQKMRGERHFVVLGRQPYDLNRTATANMWGLPLISQAELANVTFMLWEQDFSPSVREMGVPYPTAFHPSTDADLKLWQETVKEAKREWLVSYLGSARRRFRHENVLVFRKELKRQCEEEKNKCRFMDCTLQYTQWQIPCENEPEIVMLEFTNAVFCLQPEGDTPTRKGIFDSMIAGCIPIVFSNFTAHFQYGAYLPFDPSLYSVMLNAHDIAQNKTNFIQELTKIPPDKVRQMQDTIREDIIPRIIYSMPGASISFDDAMDTGIRQLLSKFSSLA